MHPRRPTLLIIARIIYAYVALRPPVGRPPAGRPPAGRLIKVTLR